MEGVLEYDSAYFILLAGYLLFTKLFVKRQGQKYFQKNRITDRTNPLFLSWLSRRSFFFSVL
ncbi:UNVERIFIED_ORG: hypothetical protein B5F06_16015 [Lacrimispora saccharolytica]